MSYLYNVMMGGDTIRIPRVSWDSSLRPRSEDSLWQGALQTILKWGPYPTELELIGELRKLPGDGGTRVSWPHSCAVPAAALLARQIDVNVHHSRADGNPQLQQLHLQIVMSGWSGCCFPMPYGGSRQMKGLQHLLIRCLWSLRLSSATCGRTRAGRASS